MRDRVWINRNTRRYLKTFTVVKTKDNAAHV